MSVLADVAAGAGGALVSQMWKLAALVLACLLLVVGTGGGVAWWLASAARDQALADLRKEQGVNAQLRAGVDTQNTAIRQWHEAAKTAEARGAVAMKVAEANGRRYDQALQQMAGARATTCEEAMPYVNRMLESVRK